MSADNNDGKKIQLNRKLRLWNKYKNPIIGAVSAIIVIVIAVVVLRACSIGRTDDNAASTKADRNNSTTTAMNVTEKQTSSGVAEATTAATTEATTQAAQPATTQAAVTGNVVKINDKAVEEEYTSKDAYSDAVLFGDMIIAGIEDYAYLGSGSIVSDNNLTTDKALNYVSDVKDRNPSKVYVLVGLNDLNYGTRSGEDVAERIGTIVSSLKEQIPSAKIYVVSLLPVTENFEAKSSVKIKQTDIDAANKKLSEEASAMGMTFIDIADSFKDGTGYLDTEFSSGGYNLNHNYYPFFLNKLAGATR